MRSFSRPSQTTALRTERGEDKGLRDPILGGANLLGTDQR